MAKTTKQVAKTCHHCQLKKVTRRRPAGLLQPVVPRERPFLKCGNKPHGPATPRTTSSGNQHIVVAVDYFSTYVISRPLSSYGIAPTRKFLQEEIVSKFVIPERVISGRGSTFTSTLWKETLLDLTVTHSIATTERLQTNGLVERQNAILIDRLSAFFDSHSEWDEGLQDTVFTVNTDVHTSSIFLSSKLCSASRPDFQGNFPAPPEEEPCNGETVDRREAAHFLKENVEAAQKKGTSTTTQNTVR